MAVVAPPAPLGLQPAGLTGLGGMAKVDDLKKLQSEVGQVRDRLDFLSSMIPSVNLAQDYFQKMECEASVQLLRMQNAQVRSQVPKDDEDAFSNTQLETTKWLHHITDVVIALHSAASATSSTGMNRSPGQSGGGGSMPSSPPLVSELISPRSPRSPRSNNLSSAFSATFSGDIQRRPSAIFSSDAQAVSVTVRRSPAPQQVDPLSASATRMRILGSSPAVQQGLEPRGAGGGGYLLSKSPQPIANRTPPPATVEPSSASIIRLEQQLSSAVAARSAAVVAHHANQVAQSSVTSGAARSSTSFDRDEPLAEPGTGGTSVPMVNEKVGGLALGRGSWAAAYRQASGARRDALELLCTSGIVTARELSDDLTVITEEHINECVQIAGEMLQTWPLDMWAKQPQEAKKFFEARLTAMYQRKFGEAKG